jgi:hypothetical protein
MEIYVSADVEADGPVPGPNSLLSLGLAVCGTAGPDGFAPQDPTARTFYAELRPAGAEFDPEALAVSGLDRERLAAEGRDPAEAMTAAAAWVRRTAAGALPVLVAYPLGYDWMWLYWYFVRFSGTGSPFGHSRHIDLKTLYATKAGVPVGHATKSRMPRALLSDRPHTHNALDDAVEQAELFCNLMAWTP